MIVKLEWKFVLTRSTLKRAILLDSRIEDLVNVLDLVRDGDGILEEVREHCFRRENSVSEIPQESGSIARPGVRQERQHVHEEFPVLEDVHDDDRRDARASAVSDDLYCGGKKRRRESLGK